jgi:hypothetical protein
MLFRYLFLQTLKMFKIFPFRPYNVISDLYGKKCTLNWCCFSHLQFVVTHCVHSEVVLAFRVSRF